MGGYPLNRRGIVLLAFLAAIAAILHFSTWFILDTVTNSFDEELGLRLTTVASAAVTAATPELLLDSGVGDDTFVRRTLTEIAGRHGLDDVFIVDAEGKTRFDLGDLSVGPRPAFVNLDPAPFDRALAGAAAASKSIDVGGVILKAGYAPIEAWDGRVEAVLGVIAGADFLERVPNLRRTLAGVAAGSAALIALLGALFFGTTRRLALAEAALARSETLSAMGLMAAGVAHEIRNPLTIIAASAARLKKKLGAGGPASPGAALAAPEFELLDSIPEEVERLNGILEGYLRFARDEPLAFVDSDLAALARRSVSLLATALEESRVVFELEGADAPIPLRADPHRLQQVLLNLLLNAAQAMPNGGAVSVKLTSNEKRATLAVADRGPGLSRDELRDAFEPFYTTKKKGSGLGLVMAKRMVEAHGGSIQLANREGGGAVATVSIPRVPPTEE